MNFKKWVKSIQTAGYDGARTVGIYFLNFSLEIGTKTLQLYSIVHSKITKVQKSVVQCTKVHNRD